MVQKYYIKNEYTKNREIINNNTITDMKNNNNCFGYITDSPEYDLSLQVYWIKWNFKKINLLYHLYQVTNSNS